LRMIFAIAFLLLVSSAVVAQAEAGYPGQKGNLRGLSGVGLVVILARADGLDEAQRPEVLKMLKAETTAQLQKAGIPLLRSNDEFEKAGSPRLVVLITLDKLNGFVHPLVTEVKLVQKVRLARDASIETDAVTWRTDGIGGPKLEIPMIRHQVGTEIDQFIKDYFAENPKQSARSNDEVSKSRKR